MTEIQKSRRSRGLKSMSAAVVAGASVVGLVLGTGTASAAVDSTNTVVDANGNVITVSLSDTFINSVSPLDGNPLTREWFANGVAGWTVTGPDADDFEGTVAIGYQVGYP
ncbi:MAG: MspA family porin, partial [Rhodococcus sp. (in: high G+C Gram-positive bacteria)]